MEIDTNNKRKIYLFLSEILWLLLSVIAYVMTEKFYINNQLSQGVAPVSVSGGFFLSPIVAIAFLIVGAVFGYFIGTLWWRLVYVERRHWRFKKQLLN